VASSNDHNGINIPLPGAFRHSRHIQTTHCF
jgi:hypothetical protein